MRINHTNVMDEYDEDEYGGQHIEMKEVCAMNSKTHILKPNHYYLSTNTSTHTGHILDTSGHILDTSPQNTTEMRIYIRLF